MNASLNTPLSQGKISLHVNRDNLIVLSYLMSCTSFVVYVAGGCCSGIPKIMELDAFKNDH